jgi:hypothetical protein
MNCPLKAMTVLPLRNVVSELVSTRGRLLSLVIVTVSGEVLWRLFKKAAHLSAPLRSCTNVPVSYSSNVIDMIDLL